MITDKKIHALQKQKSKIEIEKMDSSQKISEIDEKIAKEYFGKMTYEEVEKLGNKDTNKNNFATRIEIYDMNPNLEHRVDKLASHGGLGAGEIEGQLLTAKFGESEWMEDAHGLFDEYLKKNEN